MTRAASSEAGAMIGGYQVRARLAAGGQGEVYLARSQAGDLVALKVLHTRWLADAKAMSRLGMEVAAVQRVAAFCTARVLEACLDHDPPFIVSEYIAGPTLAEQVERNGPLRGAALERVAIGTASALAAIHAADVVHRDIKPQNVILGPDGPRVIDFGIALGPDSQTTTGSMVVGTPLYMAPERFEGGRAGPEADIFAWGSMMAFAATGHAPFEGPTPSAVMFKILTEQPTVGEMPLPLRPLIRRCLARDPADRPSAPQLMLELVGHGDVIAAADGRPADGAHPDAARPDAARPDTARPDTARPDSGRPDAARPGADRPDAGHASGRRHRGRRRAVIASGAMALAAALAITLLALDAQFGQAPASSQSRGRPAPSSNPASGQARYSSSGAAGTSAQAGKGHSPGTGHSSARGRPRPAPGHDPAPSGSSGPGGLPLPLPSVSVSSVPLP